MHNTGNNKEKKKIHNAESEIYDTISLFVSNFRPGQRGIYPPHKSLQHTHTHTHTHTLT